MPQAPAKVNWDKIRALPIITNDPTRKFNEKEEEYLRQIIKCEFLNIEEPGLSHSFSYGNAKNKHTFTFNHGERYEIPRFIKLHVESRSTPIWKWIPDGSGSMQKQRKGDKPRFQMREVY